MKPSYAIGLVTVMLLTLWGFALWGANADAIWVDEWWTTYYIGAAPNSELTTPAQVIDRVAANRVHENNPVGYYVILHLWEKAVGRSDVALRMFSALCSLLTVAFLYRLGRAIGGVQVGLAAALILSFSAFFVNYSHEMRMYALAAMWGSLGLLAYWKFMHLPKASPVWGGLLLLGATGLVYTHYGNAMLVVLLGLCHLFVRPKNRRWWQAVAIAISAGGLFIPHLTITLGIGNRFTEKLTTTDTIQGGIWSVPDVLRMTLLGFANEQIVFLLLLGAAALLAAQPYFMRDEKRKPPSLPLRIREGLLLSGAMAVGGILTLVALRLAFQTVFHVRYLLVVWLPLSLFSALVITQGLQRLDRVWQRGAAVLLAGTWVVAGIILISDIHFHGVYIHPLFRQAFTEPARWDDLGDQLRETASPLDAVAISVGEDLAWAHRGDAEYYAAQSPGRLLMLEGDKTNPDDFRDFIHGASRVWLARWLNSEPSPNDQQMQAVIQAEGYTACGDPQVQGGISLTLYSVVPQCCAAPGTFIGSFGDVAQLGYHHAEIHDGLLQIWQGWQVSPDAPADVYSIGWYVFDKTGAVTAQLDRALPASGYQCLLAEIPVAEGSAAEVRTGVYNWSNGERLALSSTAANADNLLIAPLDDQP